MGIEFNVKFPCGYEISMKAKIGWLNLGSAEFDEKDFRQCPLHGKNCPPMMKAKKPSHNYAKDKLNEGDNNARRN